MRISIYLCFLILISNCSPKEQSIDDKLLECFYNSVPKGTKSKFESLGKIYLKHGLIVDIEGTEFMKLIEHYKSETTLPFVLTEELLVDLKELGDIPDITCNSQEISETIDFENSKFYQVILMFDDAGRLGNSDGHYFADRLSKIFTKEDFEHELYQDMALSAIYCIIRQELFFNSHLYKTKL